MSFWRVKGTSGASGGEMARNSDSEDTELFRGKNVGSVEQYFASDYDTRTQCGGTTDRA